MPLEKIIAKTYLPALNVFLGVLLGVVGIFFIIANAGVVTSMYDVKGVESNVVHTLAVTLVQNKNLYSNPEMMPHWLATFSPLYYLIVDGLLSLFSISYTNYQLIWIIARSVSVAASLGAVWCLFVLLYRILHTSQLHAIVLSGSLFLFSFPLYSISRPDAFVALFSVAAYIQLNKYLEERKNIHCFFIGCCGMLAVASKLTGIHILATAGLFFLINANFRAIAYLIAGVVSVCLFITAILHWGDYGLNYVYENVVDGVRNGSSFKHFFIGSLTRFIKLYTLFVAFTLVLAYLQKETLVKLKKNSFGFYLFMNASLLLVYDAVASLKVGSAYYYYFDFLICLLVICGWLFTNIKPNWLPVATAGLLLSSLVISILIAREYSIEFGIPFGKKRETAQATENREKVIDYLHAHLANEYLFSHDRNIALSFPLNAVLFQYDVHNTNYVNTTNAINYSNIQASFENGKVKYIILPHNGWLVAGIEDILKRKYQADTAIANYTIYKYKY